MGHRATISLLARPTGAIVEVFHDELELTTRSDHSLKAILDPSSVPQAALFLQAIRKTQFALDYELQVVRPAGSMSLIFSGCKSGHTILILGAPEALSRESLLQELKAIADHYSARRQIPHEGSQRRIGLDWNVLLEATAHELRNPIHGILAASQYLLEDAARLLKPEHFTLLASVESASRMMLRVIDDLVEGTAIESGELRLVLEPTDILELVKRNLSLNRLSAARKEIRIDLSSAGNLPSISLDPVSISRVFDILLTKCIQSSTPGGRIKIFVDIKGQQAIISVQSERSFLSTDEFHFLANQGQAGSYALPKAKPSQIIAFRMASKIIERHGGSIQVENGPGKGLTFILALPLAVVRVRTQEGG